LNRALARLGKKASDTSQVGCESTPTFPTRRICAQRPFVVHIVVAAVESVEPVCQTLMPVFQHSVMQRNVTQRKKWCVLFHATADAATAFAASCGAPQANRNDFYFFPQRRRRTGPIRAAIMTHSTNGTAVRRCTLCKKVCKPLRYCVTLR